MSRLPTSGFVTTTTSISGNRLKRQPSQDLRKRRTISENVPPMPTTKALARSRSFIGDTRNGSPKPTLRTNYVSSPPNHNNTLYIGDRVAVDSMSIIGTLRFLGEADFKEGYWAGIQLDVVGAGKNDGSVKGVHYFSCPAQTGLFVLASKVTPLNTDSDSVRSLSPPSYNSVPIQQGNSTKRLSLITSGSRAARYIDMTANQLNQQQQRKEKPRTHSMSSTTSLMSPLTSPVSRTSSGRNSFRGRSQQHVQSPTPTHYNSNRPITIPPSPAMTPTNHHRNPQDTNDDYYLLNSDDMMITETPIPANLAHSRSIPTNTNILSAVSNSTTSSSSESAHERLERVLGEAIAQAPDETVMRLQQLQLRVEVLEAENKFLKLENTQNKTAEQILERSLVLKAGSATGGQELFTLEGHKAIVNEIKEAHTTEVKTMQSQHTDTLQRIQRLETRVQELEAEQTSLITERDKALFDLSTVRKEKSQVESKVLALESKLAETEAAMAAKQASERLHQERQQQQFFHPSQGGDHDDEATMNRQMQLELEMEEVHEKMNSLRDAARAKDMFLTALTEQVEQHRNAVEEKEREIRRIKADSDRHMREKERLLQELQEVEAKWLEHQDCTSKDVYEKIKKELAAAKENLAQEQRLVRDCKERIGQLQESVDELKKAGMESIELYESSVEMNRVDREALTAGLADERRKVAALEIEREELRTAGLDAIEAYEATIEEMKQERHAQMQEFEFKRSGLQSTIETLKQEIDQLMKNVETEEKHTILKDVWESERKRLTEQIEMLEKEGLAHQAFVVEAEGWKDQSKETEKMSKEKTKLEEQLSRLQADYEDQLASRTKYLEEVRTAVESQKKTEGELRRLTEAKEKLEREVQDLEKNQKLLLTTTNGSVNNEQYALQVETFRSEIEKLQAQNDMLLKQKQQAEQSNQDTTQYQHLITILKTENKKLVTHSSELEESFKQAQTECLKLMEENVKLHQQVGQDEATNLILKDGATSEESKITKLLARHTTELREAKEKTDAAEKEQKRQVKKLNQDISDLESLIESKIFKEADLEEALEVERRKVKKLQLEVEDLKEDNGNKTVVLPTKITKPIEKKQLNVNDNSSSDPDALYCEICEEPGHDLISCKAVSIDNKQFRENYEEFTNERSNQNETF